MQKSPRFLSALTTSLLAATLISTTAQADDFPGAPGSSSSDGPAKPLTLPFGLNEKPSGVNDEKFKTLRAQCETEVGCGKNSGASGDVCAEAAALVLQEKDFPSQLVDLSGAARARIALRLLERGVDTSNLAAARAFDIYDKTDYALGLMSGGVPDPWRAKELEELLTKRGYPGMALRKARSNVSMFAVTVPDAEKKQSCELAANLKTSGKLDNDSADIAKQVLTSSFCEGLAAAAAQAGQTGASSAGTAAPKAGGM